MAEEVSVKLSMTQARAMHTILGAFPNSPVTNQIMRKLEKAIEYRKNNPSPYVQRRKAKRINRNKEE